MPQRLTNKINPIDGQPEKEMVSAYNVDMLGGENPYKDESTNGAEDNVGENQAYYDATKVNKQTSYEDSVAKAQGESKAKMNTGTGASAAVGTTYSWDTKGKELAENAYQQKVLEEKQNMLTQRQEMEKNAQQYQTQADMQKYSDNQTADKVGWTGGYVLDQERQREYMKQSIQAQLYGAMELQKYGYDTAMAAARLSYDANLLTYAQEYYNQAVQNSLNEAQITGVYFSAEVKDMLSQYTIAEAKLKDSSLSREERDRARKIKSTINDWFNTNEISDAGIKTLEAWSAEQSLELQWSNELWTKYNAALQASNNTLTENSDAFIMLDDKGNPMYDGTSIKTLDWSTISGSDIADYLTEDTTGQKTQQFLGYLDKQLANKSAADFTKWAKSQGYISTDEQGNTTVSGNYKDLYGEFLGESDAMSSFINSKFANLKENQAKVIIDKLNGYSVDIDLPDGTTATYTLSFTGKVSDSKGNIEGANIKNTDNSNSLKESYFVLDKTYTEANQKAMLNTLFDTDNNGELKNKNFEELLQILEGCTGSNPDTWNEDNGWYNGLVKGEVWGPIVTAINDWAGLANQHPYEAGQAVEKILNEINTKIGEENINLLGSIADKWNNMSDREKMLLSDKERSYYEQASNFMLKICQLMEARDYYYRNDSSPFTWQYIGDSWKKVGYQWTHINSFGDALGAVGQTITSVGTSVVSGITGFFANLVTWHWSW